MKLLAKLLVVLSLFNAGYAIAHGEGHGDISPENAISQAMRSAKMLTFKDYGMSVGKISQTWNNTPIESYKVVEESDDLIVVKAVNGDIGQSLYFLMNKAGQVNDVRDASSFKSTHGHSH